MNNNAQHFEQFLKDYKALRRKLPRMYGIEAVNLFKENFDKEGFIAGNGRLQKWKPTNRKKGRKILTKSRRLKRGIHMKSYSAGKIVISVDTNIKYAELHNSGGKLEITPKMRRFFWAKYIETSNQVLFNVKLKREARTKKNREINAEAEMWKSMALTKKTHFDIPKRQFIGNTLAMKPRLNRRTIKEIKKITQKYTK